MISSFFGKTKPINYIIVLTFLFIFYCIARFLRLNADVTPQFLFSAIGVLSILLFSFFVVNFIVKRNKITKANSFAILFYGLLWVLFPESLLDNNGIFCSFFILLATRKLLSLKSLKDIRYKIFDATMWVLIASLFYDWALLYLLWIFIAIYIYEPKNIRNWFVPLSAFIAIFLITLSILLLCEKTDFFQNHYTFSLELDEELLLDWKKGAKLIIYIIITLFVSFWAGVRLVKSGVGRVSSIRLITFSFSIGIILTLLEASNEVFPILVTFFPASVFLTNYVEALRNPRIRELVLISSIITPFLVFVFEYIN